MSENKNKYLLKNTIALSLGNFGSKLITFLLVPLYTNILSIAEYGMIDLVTVITTVVVPIITLNIHEAVMRFMMDKNSDSNNVLSIGIGIILITALLCLILLPIFRGIDIISQYAIFLVLYILSLAILNIFMCYLRGKEKLLDYSLIGIFQSLLIAVLNIFFLAYLKIGIKGYIIAYILANLLATIICIIRGKVFKSFKFSYNKKLAHSMLKYSIFLIPNSLMWWIINSSDRFMVTSMINIEANGIYSVSYKIPTILVTLTTIFNQAWMFSAIKENQKNKEEKSKYTNTIFSGLYNIVICLSLGMLLILKPFMKIYVGKEFYSSWQYTPVLIIGAVFLTMGTFISNEYTANKDSWGFLKSSCIAAILNIILNFILIPLIGILGAAIATGISYISVFIFRYFDTKKYVGLQVLDTKKIISFLLLLTASLMVYYDNNIIYIFLLLTFLLELLINIRFWKKLVLFGINILRKKKVI